MTNDLIRGDVNWFDRRCSQRRSARVAGRRSRVATAQDERRRSITLGSMMTFASLAAQPNPRWSCRPKNRGLTISLRELHRLMATDREIVWDLPSDLPHALPEARGLGVTVRRRQCKNCRLFQCLCVFWRFCACSDGTPRQSSLHPTSPLRESDPLSTSLTTFSRRLSACSNDRPFTMAARPNRLRLIKKPRRFGTTGSARRGCRPRTGA